MDVAGLSNQRIEEIFDTSLRYGVTFEEAMELEELRESLEVTKDMLFNNRWVDLDTELDLSEMFNDERGEMMRRFTSIPLSEGQKELCEAMRHIARDMAVCIRDLCPEGHEKQMAIDALDTSVMFANAAIARGGKDGC